VIIEKYDVKIKKVLEGKSRGEGIFDGIKSSQ
jgi:hypothetical protein